MALKEHNAFDDTPWINTLVEYTKRALETKRIRIIGVCFGHQILGRALGAKVGRNELAWEVASNEVNLTSKGKEIFGKDVIVSIYATPPPPAGKSIFFLEVVAIFCLQTGWNPLQSLHQMHRDIIFNYPPDVEELGSSPVCKVQGMYSRKRLISVQGHPEFNQTIITEIIKARHSQGVFDDVQYEDGMKKAALHHDGVLVAQAFLRFLIDD